MKSILEKLRLQTLNQGACHNVDAWMGRGDVIESISPATGQTIAAVRLASVEDYESVVGQSTQSFERWREVPAPVRGRMIRDLGELLRRYAEPLGELVTLEMGKIRAEGIGEVQEMIDVCEFAVGLSRQLCGSTMHSERPGHRMYEQWHPLGPVAIISAFNFPVAVWSWNAALAAVCGDSMVWKPSPQTPLTAIAVQHLCNEVMRDHQADGVFGLVVGDNQQIASRMIDDKRFPLVSFTGSTKVGRMVGQRVAARMGKTLLELGGNNAIIVEADADLDLALRGILFGAVGTAGQRCTTTRRLIVHDSIIDELVSRLARAYSGIRIGDPLDPATLVGPLVSPDAVRMMQSAITQAIAEGGKLVVGGKPITGMKGNYVEPAIIRMPSQTPQVQQEVFAPILYVMGYQTLDQAIAMQNGVPQGLSSSIFTTSLQSAERFLAATGSDCGIANVNIGTSGAEIGGAFGGEKETGGGRESGSDSWRAYMRRQTNTINWSKQLPLAQGLQFGDGG